MKKLFYEYPNTIGKELKAQIEYCKSIGIIKNTEDLSIKMRELEKEVFGKVRQYKTKDEREYNLPIDNTTRNARAGTITDLCKITLNEKISSYMLMFSAFKALNIIKEDINIIDLLDYYYILPKKDEDKKRIEIIKSQIDKEPNLILCCECKEKKRLRCENYKYCLFRRIKKKLEKIIDEDEKIKFLYNFGFQSNWFDSIEYKRSYIISINTLKCILNYFGEIKKIKFINDIEDRYNNYCKIDMEKIRKREKFWKNKLKESKTKILELEKTKDIKKLKELKARKIYYNYNEIFAQPLTNMQKERANISILKYYLGLIEENCYIKRKMPRDKKTIH